MFYQMPEWTQVQWKQPQGFIFALQHENEFGLGVFSERSAKAKWFWQRNKTQEAANDLARMQQILTKTVTGEDLQNERTWLQTACSSRLTEWNEVNGLKSFGHWVAQRMWSVVTGGSHLDKRVQAVYHLINRDDVDAKLIASEIHHFLIEHPELRSSAAQKRFGEGVVEQIQEGNTYFEKAIASFFKYETVLDVDVVEAGYQKIIKTGTARGFCHPFFITLLQQDDRRAQILDKASAEQKDLIQRQLLLAADRSITPQKQTHHHLWAYTNYRQTVTWTTPDPEQATAYLELAVACGARDDAELRAKITAAPQVQE